MVDESVSCVRTSSACTMWMGRSPITWFFLLYGETRIKSHEEDMSVIRTDSTKSADSMFVRHVWQSHLRINKLLKDLRSGPNPELEAEVVRLREMRFNEFEGVTSILRTWGQWSHFHSRLTLLWESECRSVFDIDWETHALCVKDMRTISYGGMLKKVSRKAAVQGFAPETAVDFARIINECETGFGAARGYAFISVSRTEKEALKKMLAPMPGMKQCCEFQFSFKDEQGVEIGQPRFIRYRHCSDTADKYQVCDILKRPSEWGKFCSKCSFINQRVLYHLQSTICPNKLFRTPFGLFTRRFGNPRVSDLSPAEVALSEMTSKVNELGELEKKRVRVGKKRLKDTSDSEDVSEEESEATG